MYVLLPCMFAVVPFKLQINFYRSTEILIKVNSIGNSLVMNHSKKEEWSGIHYDIVDLIKVTVEQKGYGSLKRKTCDGNKARWEPDLICGEQIPVSDKNYPDFFKTLAEGN